jgi:hypothetical protein
MQPTDDIISFQRRVERRLALGVGFVVGGALTLLIMFVALKVFDEKCSAPQQSVVVPEVRVMRCDLRVLRGASSLDEALTDATRVESTTF